jgi:hypothetical protein
LNGRGESEEEEEEGTERKEGQEEEKEKKEKKRGRKKNRKSKQRKMKRKKRNAGSEGSASSASVGAVLRRDYHDPFEAEVEAAEAKIEVEAKIEAEVDAASSTVGTNTRSAHHSDLLRELVVAVAMLSEALGNSMRLYPWRWLVLGPAGGGSNFHRDYWHTGFWNACVSGAKHWVLVDPSEAGAVSRDMVRTNYDFFEEVYPQLTSQLMQVHPTPSPLPSLTPTTLPPPPSPTPLTHAHSPPSTTPITPQEQQDQQDQQDQQEQQDQHARKEQEGHSAKTLPSILECTQEAGDILWVSQRLLFIIQCVIMPCESTA